MYKTLLVIHIIAIISWMAAILYLYRLFINHVDYGMKSRDNHDLLCGMERRLLRIILLPSMAVAYMAGLTMISLSPELLGQTWIWIKLANVLGLTGMSFYGYHLVRRFADRDPTIPSSKTLRILNEVPTILMIVIVSMVIFRP